MPKSSIHGASAEHVQFSVPFEPGIDGFENMRRDAALLPLGRLCARLYTWNGPWVSLGISQDPERDLRPGQPVPVVKRPTGGRAVLHGHDLTLGLACPLVLLAEPGQDPRNLSRSIRAVYRRIIEPITLALVDVGVPADLAERTRFVKQPGRSADCFATASANDVVRTDTGAKVCGVALRVTDTTVLVQASIPAGRPEVDPRTVFAEPAQSAWSEIPIPEFQAALTSNLLLLLA